MHGFVMTALKWKKKIGKVIRCTNIDGWTHKMMALDHWLAKNRSLK